MLACRCIFALIVLGLVLLAGCVTTTSADGQLARFTFQQAEVNNGNALSVVYYRPHNYHQGSPVLFVIHGNSRNPVPYCDSWIEQADISGALVICPDFARDNGFPTSDEFNLGRMFELDDKDRISKHLPETAWSFTLIEAIFDDVRVRFDNQSTGYLMFGHSAGSQFAHRLLAFKPAARAEKVVAANAGWYTLPDENTRYPYGLGGTSYNASDLAAFFARDLTILLGEADIDPAGRNLRQTVEARNQGQHRFERGHFFFELSQRKASELGFTFNWQLQTVPGVGHSQRGMAKAAADIFFTN